MDAGPFELYIALLSKCASRDPKDVGLAWISLELLAVAQRPLSISELSWAVAIASAPAEISKVATLADRVDHERVLSLIHPFIARVDFNDLKKYQVRLSDQSMKDSIFRAWSGQPYHLLGYSQTFPTQNDVEHVEQRIKSLHAALLDICISYLLLEEIGGTELFSVEQLAIDEMPEEIDLFSKYELPVEYDHRCSWEVWEKDMIRFDPAERGFGEFFVYASSHWLEHYSAIGSESLPELDRIERLCTAGSTRLSNWTKQNCRPGCTIRARFPFDCDLYDPLSITSLYGSDAMLHKLLAKSEFGRSRYLVQPGIGATDQPLRWGDLTRAATLFLDSRLCIQLQNQDFFEAVMGHWANDERRAPDWGTVFDTVNHVVHSLVEECWGHGLWQSAIQTGCTPLIHRLKVAAQSDSRLEAELLRSSARERGHLELIK